MTTATACGRCNGKGSENTETEYRDCPMCSRSGDAVPCSFATAVVIPTGGGRLRGRIERCNQPSVDWNDESPRCEAHLKGK